MADHIILDPRQRKIMGCLKKWEPLGQLYIAALYNLLCPTYPARLKVVCYCCREITSHLASFVCEEDFRQVKYKERTNEIYAAWPEDILADYKPGSDGPAKLQVDLSACRAVDKLVSAHNENGESKSRSISMAFEILAPQMPAKRREELKCDWMKFDKDCNKGLHTSRDGCFASDLKNVEDVLRGVENVLIELLESPSVISQLDTIYAILQDTNETTD